MRTTLLILILMALGSQNSMLPLGSELCVHAQVIVMAQEGEQDGNPGHVAPPPGWFCSTDSPVPAKRCRCHRVDVSQHCEAPDNEIREDPKCKAWCFRSSCQCKVHCEPADPHAPAPQQEEM